MASSDRAQYDPRADDDADEADPRDVYETVLRIVDYNTSPMQSPGMPRHALTLLATPPEGRHSLDDVDSAIAAAREADDLVKWPGRDGKPRYTLATVEDLRRVAEAEGTREHPRTDLLGDVNTLIAEVNSRE